MKKLFSILVTSALTLTATISTIACNNSADNTKNNKNEDEEREEIFKDKINAFLSTFEFEFVGDDNKDMRITDPKSGWYFTIVRSKGENQSQEKEFTTVSELTDKIWPDKKNYENDIVEIITGFALTPPNMPNDYPLQDKANIQMPKGSWEYSSFDSSLSFFKGSVEIKGKNNAQGGAQILQWKMGFLKKENYFKALYEQALTYYFHSNLDIPNNVTHSPFLVEKDFVFDDQWIKKSVLDYIDSGVITKNSKDESLKQILNNLFEKLEFYLAYNDGEGTKVKEGTWNPNNPDTQWVGFKVVFKNNDNINIEFYLKPKK